MRHSSRMLRALLLLLLTAARPSLADPRPPEVMDGAEIRHALKKLQVVGSALYVAAHPDDENTALLSWLSSGRKVRTAYLSVTRGDGGQNLIGQEFGAALGVLRTQELMAARRVDGAEQMFTRALDFGYSKRADETLAFWDHDSVLADVVWAIRRFRPDVIITRFPPDSTAGHGHHTASAMLAEEAFAAAADPARFPGQLRWVSPWQAKRIVWNAWSGRGVTPDPSWPTVDLGGYDALLGRSYSEIAGLSRSNHKSQGFGAPERRGSSLNAFAPRGGTPAGRDLFDGVDLTWKRIAGGAKVAALLETAERAFDPQRPGAILPLLARAHAAMAGLADESIVRAKRAELREVIRSCAGLWLEAVASKPVVVAGEPLRVTTSALNRSDAAVTLESVTIGAAARTAARPLPFNSPVGDTLQLSAAADAPLSQPYWLREQATRGRFVVPSQAEIGLPENPPAMVARFVVRVAGEAITYERPLAYRWVDPVEGERWRNLEVAPPATLAFGEPFYAFSDRTPRTLAVTVHAHKSKLAGTLRLELPAGWSVAPLSAPVAIEAEGGEATTRFMLTPGPAAVGGTVLASIESGGGRWSHRLETIDHPHVPVQALFPPAQVPLVLADQAKLGERVGYVAGSGDRIPEALRQMGYQVALLTDEDLEGGDLTRFDAIVTGVRAYNTRPRLRAIQPRLLEWVASGGTLVVQYVTVADGPVDYLGPLPFKVSRDRVSDENAPVRMLLPAHRLLTTPNRIGPADFDGWVQERGLYFAGQRDPGYEAVLGSADPGEKSLDGGLLYVKHGRGAFVYCGYAMFRQIPAGVPGAWRLLANLVSAK